MFHEINFSEEFTCEVILWNKSKVRSLPISGNFFIKQIPWNQLFTFMATFDCNCNRKPQTEFSRLKVIVKSTITDYGQYDYLPTLDLVLIYVHFLHHQGTFLSNHRLSRYSCLHLGSLHRRIFEINELLFQQFILLRLHNDLVF